MRQLFSFASHCGRRLRALRVRQMDDEGRPMPHLTADAYFTTMRLHDLLHYGKTETRAMTNTTRTGRIRLVEAIKQTGQRLTRDAGAGIRYG